MARPSAQRPATTGWALPALLSMAAHGAVAVVLVGQSGRSPVAYTDVPVEGSEFALTLLNEPTAPVPTIEPKAEPQPRSAEPERSVVAEEPSAPAVAAVEPARKEELVAPPPAVPKASTPVDRASSPSFRDAGSVRSTPPADVAAPVSMPVATERTASFAGVKAERAKKVVYAVDASGVMVSSLPFVLDELERNISKLEPDQEFQVIVFQEPLRPQDETTGPEPAIERLLEHTSWLRNSPEETKPELLSGTTPTSHGRGQIEDLRRRIKPGGPSNPLTGLRVALSLKPDVIFLLSRGIKRSGTAWGPGVEEVLAALDRANPKDAHGHRPVQIKTVQFVEADPTGLMDRIAKEHGGPRPAAGATPRAAVLTVNELRVLGRTNRKSANEKP